MILTWLDLESRNLFAEHIALLSTHLLGENIGNWQKRLTDIYRINDLDHLVTEILFC